MPAFSFRVPRFLRARRERRSDSSELSPVAQCDAVTASHSPPSQHSSVPEPQGPSNKDLSQLQYQNHGMFYQAHNLSATGNFVDGNVGVMLTNNFNIWNNFMEKLLKETIPGAAADSSARDPPPRCHPGTRLAILERCLYFISHCNGVKKTRWVVGAAGVGKSAVMQSVADSPQLVVASNASVFFSINGRSDGTKAIMTLSYQLAAKVKAYRQVIERQVADDPQLLQSSMAIQFEKFIVQPFIHNTYLNSAGRVLIIIDGLDECNNTRTQTELLRLISNFCLSYPSSPIVWLIASRPEPHITSFFSRPDVVTTYEIEEIAVDSDEARADVERFLRHELTEIGKVSDFLSPQWPDEQDLWKLATAADGLFAYAHTAIRYIGDSNIGDPVSQLSDVLNVIDKLPLSNVPREQHPMALLDALYERILSNVPPKIMINARKFLLLLASDWDVALPYDPDEAYAALNRLRSVFDFPQRHKAHEKMPQPFHKSLIDYIFRSPLFPDINSEVQQIKSKCAFRVLMEAPGGIDIGDNDNNFYWGALASTGGSRDKISITWRADEGTNCDDTDTRLSMYMLAIGEVVAGIERGDPVFQSQPCIALLTQFREYSPCFPGLELCNLVYDKSRRHEFMKCGILKQIPAKSISISEINKHFHLKLQFYCPVATTTLLDPWNSSCEHERVGQWEQGKEQNWTTVFEKTQCAFCFERLGRQFEVWISQHPDHAVSSMFGSAEDICVELRIVDPKDHMSEWTYWFWIEHSSEEGEQLESSV